MSISVIIPLYNKSSTIKETLQSVLCQTFTNFEVIIINDGSTDNSLEIVASFNDNRITVISQENKGAANARNNGIIASKNNLIAFIDADDYWFPNHLDEISKLAFDYDTCGMFCSRYKIKIATKTIENVSYSISDDFRGIVPDFFESSLKNRIALTSALAIKKDVFDTIGYFDENLVPGEDLDLWIRIALIYKVAITNKTTCIYNFESNNISKTSILNHKISDFKEFESFEIDNTSLKRFLDLHRVFYSIKFRVSGNINKSNEYLEKVNPDSILYKTKILLKLPPIILRFLISIKHYFRKIGFNFTLYK